MNRQCCELTGSEVIYTRVPSNAMNGRDPLLCVSYWTSSENSTVFSQDYGICHVLNQQLMVCSVQLCHWRTSSSPYNHSIPIQSRLWTVAHIHDTRYLTYLSYFERETRATKRVIHMILFVVVGSRSCEAVSN